MRFYIGLCILCAAIGTIGDHTLNTRYPNLSKMNKVIVLDTGFNISRSESRLCPSGHKDFSREGLTDMNGHGSSMVSLINKYAQNSNYCLIILKVYNNRLTNSYYPEALEYAKTLNPDIINISGGGFWANRRERRAIQLLLNSNVKIVVAAGNERRNLDVACNYFPACYDSRLYVIGSRSILSNTGKIIDFIGPSTSGTSVETAIFTGLLLQGVKK